MAEVCLTRPRVLLAEDATSLGLHRLKHNPAVDSGKQGKQELSYIFCSLNLHNSKCVGTIPHSVLLQR